MGRALVTLVVAATTGCADPARAPELAARWVAPSNGMEFILVQPREFGMGLLKPPDDLRAAPPHRVGITRPYYLSRYEVTQAEWEAVVGDLPSRFVDCGPNCPVESVSWSEVARFLELLGEQNPGEVFRLPTEAEWENACRAGGDGRYGDDLDTLRVGDANFDPSIPFEGRAGPEGLDSPVPVGSYPPNSWGFHDLTGNVWEWVADEYCPYPSEPVLDPVQSCGTDTIPIRGGSWHFSANAARCGRRYTHHRADSGFSIGFRVVREVDPEKQPDESL